MDLKQKRKKIFGTDGVRGQANYFPMDVETALALGKAAGKIFRRHSGKHRVVVGKDTRLSCYMFENALIAGLCSMGIDTLMVGPFPTPAVAFITRAYRADAGIVISASHNPFQDNGIKVFSSEGYKLPLSWEAEMEQLVAENDFEESLPHDHNIGKNTKIDDADGRYIEYCKATFPKSLKLENLTIALDCANGAGYKVAPLILRELDANVFVCGNTPNGLNINDQCGSLYPNNVRKLLEESHADVGIALDGDGDRLIMVDEKGSIVDGDTILAICAVDMKERGALGNNMVVSTVMSNYGFFASMKEQGIAVVQSQVGDRFVIEDMIKHGANLGGEQSGHVIFSDYNTTGDALICALQVLKIMVKTGKKLSELARVFQPYPQTLINVKVKEKPPFDSIPSLSKEIEKIENRLKDEGRVLVRYSGTEKICRVMVEGPNLDQVNQFAEAVAVILKKEIGE